MVDIRILGFHISVSQSSFRTTFPCQLGLPSTWHFPRLFHPEIKSIIECLWESKGTPPNAILRPYFLGGWHWGRGPLRFPWNVSTKMLVGAIFINSIDVVMQRFHRDLHHKNPPNTKVVKQPRHLWSNLMMSIPTKNIISLPSSNVPKKTPPSWLINKIWWDTVKSPLPFTINPKLLATCFCWMIRLHIGSVTRDAYLNHITGFAPNQPMALGSRSPGKCRLGRWHVFSSWCICVSHDQ